MFANLGTGCAYICISHENPTQVDVYFDDLKIEHRQGHVIQYNEYYPFGMENQNSWTRENAKDNNFLYNAGNEQNALTGLYDMFYRNYDPSLGRMTQIDPAADSYGSLTTYGYANNDPVYFNDPTGAITDDQWWAAPRSTWRWSSPEHWKSQMELAGKMGSERAYRGDVSDRFFGNYMSFNNYSFSSFIRSAMRSEFGGSWNEGNVYLFESSEDAFANGVAYNQRHNSWANTEYKSLEGSVVGFGVVSQSGIMPTMGEVDAILHPLSATSGSPDPDPWYVVAFKNFIENAWNSDTMRRIVPDQISIDVTVGGGVLRGAFGSYTAHLLTRGSHPGIYVSRTFYSPYTTYGLGVGYGASLGIHR